MEKKTSKPNRVWSFRKPRSILTKKQAVLLEKLINKNYENKPSLRQQLIDRSRNLKVLEAHRAIEALMSSKSMVLA